MKIHKNTRTSKKEYYVKDFSILKIKECEKLYVFQDDSVKKIEIDLKNINLITSITQDNNTGSFFSSQLSSQEDFNYALQMATNDLFTKNELSKNGLNYKNPDFKFDEFNIEKIIQQNEFEHYSVYKEINNLVNYELKNIENISVKKLYTNDVYDLFFKFNEKKQMIQHRSILGIVLSLNYKSSSEQVIFYIHQNNLGEWNFANMIDEIKKLDELSDISYCSIDNLNNLHQLPVLLTSDVMANLLKTFSEVYYTVDLQDIYAENVSSLVNIIDIPHLDSLKTKFIFDHTGENCEKITIYRHGKFNNFLEMEIDNKGRKFLNKENRVVQFNPIHLIITPVNNNNIINDYKTDKIVINKIYGLNSGINLLNGDFNILADGEIHKNGEKYFFKSIIINDNWINVLNNVDKVYSDFKLMDQGGFGSPSVKIKKMRIRF